MVCRGQWSRLYTTEARRREGGLWSITPATTVIAAALDVLARRNSHGLRAPEPDVVVAIRRIIVVAVARPQVGRIIVEAPAADDPVRVPCNATGPNEHRLG